ncbi:MAG: signal peptidase I [Firmicutes bacterium]|nr:signal peptidase I [Candidatus Fiminaster equi]
MDENVSNEKPIKNRKRLSVLFNVFIVLLSIIALAIAGVLIYQKRYLSPFWVNGQSMYPTLNKYATKPDGTPFGVTGGAAYDGCKKLDYGVMDPHESALKKIKRFDIVVCKYDFGDEYDKIKRVVGLPGETIKFGQGNNNGTLFVKNGDQFFAQEQPIPSEYITAGDYPTNEITLGSNEYYVLGDNRAHSSDSRNNEPIKFEWLVGKVVALCAYCDLGTLSDGSIGPVNIQHYFPRFL